MNEQTHKAWTEMSTQISQEHNSSSVDSIFIIQVKDRVIPKKQKMK